MTNTLTIRVSDKATAEALAEELVKSGAEFAIATDTSDLSTGFRRSSKAPQISFGKHFVVESNLPVLGGKFKIEGESEDIPPVLEGAFDVVFKGLKEAGPAVLDAVFNTLKRFIERGMELFADGKPTTIAEQEMEAKRSNPVSSMEEFLKKVRA